MLDLASEVVGLAGLALSGRAQDIHLFVRRLARRMRGTHPEAADRLTQLLAEAPVRDALTRGAAEATSVPVDEDSRLQLLRTEYPVEIEREPILSQTIRQQLDQIVLERQRSADLLRQDLVPTRSALFVGPPGVGKSLAARWIAAQLGLPILTLHLSGVMSSFLGKTGVNIRQVLDYAKGFDCVLFLDELDAVAKRRDDSADIGELKRLVTVLLQEIDDWPPTGLLVAATNHASLLDPAIWRRFDAVVEFTMPDIDQTRDLIESVIGTTGVDAALKQVLSLALSGSSFSDIERDLLRAKRESVIHGKPTSSGLTALASNHLRKAALDTRKDAATWLLRQGLTQSDAHNWTGLHRDVIRKLQKAPKRPSSRRGGSKNAEAT
jgi:AAA+ superfamily predicted ATPase